MRDEPKEDVVEPSIVTMETGPHHPKGGHNHVLPNATIKAGPVISLTMFIPDKRVDHTLITTPGEDSPDHDIPSYRLAHVRQRLRESRLYESGGGLGHEHQPGLQRSPRGGVHGVLATTPASPERHVRDERLLGLSIEPYGYL
jgi:hypothetical protein